MIQTAILLYERNREEIPKEPNMLSSQETKNTDKGLILEGLWLSSNEHRRAA